MLRCECIVNWQCFWSKDGLNRPLLARFMAVLLKYGENGHKLTGYPDAVFLCFIPSANYHHGMFHLYEIHFVSENLWAGTNLALSITKLRSKTLDFGENFWIWRQKYRTFSNAADDPLRLFVCTALLVRMQNEGVVGWAKKNLSLENALKKTETPSKSQNPPSWGVGLSDFQIFWTSVFISSRQVFLQW